MSCKIPVMHILFILKFLAKLTTNEFKAAFATLYAIGVSTIDFDAIEEMQTIFAFFLNNFFNP